MNVINNYMKIKILIFVLSLVPTKSYSLPLDFKNNLNFKYCIDGNLDPLLEEHYKALNARVCYETPTHINVSLNRCVIVEETKEKWCEFVPKSELEELFTQRFFESLYEQTLTPEFAILSEFIQDNGDVNIVGVGEILTLLSAKSVQVISSDSIEYDSFYEDEGFQALKEEIDRTTQALLAGIEVTSGIMIHDLTSSLEKQLLSTNFVKKLTFVNLETSLISRIKVRGIQFTRNLLSVKNVRRLRGFAIFYVGSSLLTRGWKIFVEEENPGLVPLIPLTKDFFLGSNTDDNH